MIKSMFWIASLMFFALSKRFGFVWFFLQSKTFPSKDEETAFILTWHVNNSVSNLGQSIIIVIIIIGQWSNIPPQATMMMKTFFLEAETSDHGSKFEVEYQIHVSSIMWSYSLKIRPVTIFVLPYQNITGANDEKKKAHWSAVPVFYSSTISLLSRVRKRDHGVKVDRVP